MNDDTRPVGRPTVMDLMTLKKLEEAFSIGASDREACLVANISTQTLYTFQLENPEYVERKEKLKDMPKYRARANIVEAINKGDLDTSKWYNERKAKSEFSTRTETTGKDGAPLVPEASADALALAQQLNDLAKANNKGTSIGSTGTNSNSMDTETPHQE